MRGRPDKSLSARGPESGRGRLPLCAYCYATLGAIVGTTVVAKAGGAVAAKAAIGALVARFLLLRR